MRTVGLVQARRHVVQGDVGAQAKVEAPYQPQAAHVADGERTHGHQLLRFRHVVRMKVLLREQLAVLLDALRAREDVVVTSGLPGPFGQERIRRAMVLVVPPPGQRDGQRP